MINKETILSYANDNLTLLEWLKKTEQALENGVVTNFEWVTETSTSGHLKLTFSDKTLLETNTITLPKGETGETGEKGDKGDKGDKGETGKTGENYLIYNKSYDGDMIPNSTLLYNLQLTDFNRIPQVDDSCIVLYNYYKDMVLIDTYLTIATITQVTNTEAFGRTINAIKTSGKQGVQGEQGLQGEQGATGVAPNIQIGTVSTLDAGSSASASITGTTENPLLNLGIPKGQSGVDINARYKHIIQMKIKNNRPLYLNCDIINENSTPFDFSTFYDYIINMKDGEVVKCNFNGFIVGSAATTSGTVLYLENTSPEYDVYAIGVSYKSSVTENFNKNSTVEYFRDLVIPL